ncbi:MAG: radical SAM protein [Bacteroidetes bacterium]|nr:radical SAM protein [Bacteroidota bacterium]
MHESARERAVIMKHLFGPVPSRRLGISLGIDLTPQKVCTLNCVYCECGKTDHLTLERKEYVPTAEVIAELEKYLSTTPDLDAITFSGSGEPTLHSGIGEIIAWLKEHYPQHRVVVLTNGTLLWQPEVRAELMQADLVVPSLDAVSEDIFRQINRPNKHLSNSEIIEGLVTFCEEFDGEVWLEVFLIPGLNDTPEELACFREVFDRLRVDRIQLNSLDRPGAMSWVQPMPRENLMAIAALLGDEVEVIGKPVLRRSVASFSENTRETILATIRVRPCTLDDLSASLGLHALDVGKYLDVMIAEGEIEQHRGERGVFYQVKR